MRINKVSENPGVNKTITEQCGSSPEKGNIQSIKVEKLYGAVIQKPLMV